MSKKAKKLAGIDRRGENTWRIHYVKDGKRHTETVIGTQEDAIARRDMVRADIARDTWAAPVSTTLGEWADTWAEQYLKRSVSTRSCDRQKHSGPPHCPRTGQGFTPEADAGSDQ